jgi:hypothetical protein
MTRKTGTLHEDQYTFLIISHSFLLTMRNVSETFVQNIRTLILCSVNFYFKNRSLYEILWKNIVEPDRTQKTIWRTASWIPKATNVHLKYIMLIACPLQQRLHKHPLILRYTYIACLVISTFCIVFRLL